VKQAESTGPLPQAYYRRPTLEVARELLGKRLIRRSGTAWVSGEICETEAYCGPHDLACHASKGRTKRTAVMFGPPGHWYVYLIYGMYHCLNMVTEEEDFPAAVLIRGVRHVRGLPVPVKTDGPGKLCRAFSIDRSFNTTPGFGVEAGLWIEAGNGVVAPSRIEATPRIGVAYAGAYRDKPWRFLLRPE